MDTTWCICLVIAATLVLAGTIASIDDWGIQHSIETNNVDDQTIIYRMRGNNSTNLPNKPFDFEPFNHTNPHGNSWCPTAMCYNSPLCLPCNQRFLFIIATGRSGSTTLLNMFNKLPNVRLAGENYNALYEAYKLATFFDHNPKKFEDEETIAKGKFEVDNIEEGAFAHNAIPLGLMGCLMQQYMRYLDPPKFTPDGLLKDSDEERNQVLGAKIIRLQNADWHPQEAADFFEQNFPCSRFLINIRSDMEEQLQSISSTFHKGKKKKKDNNMEDELLRKNHFLLQLHDILGNDRSKMIDMSIWKDDISVLNNVVDWLGFKDCAFDALLHENFDGYGRDHQTNVHVGDNCRLTG